MLRDDSTASIWEEMQGLTVKNEQEEGHVGDPAGEKESRDRLLTHRSGTCHSRS